MAKVSGFKCECGKQKTEANRWLLGSVIRHEYFDADFGIRSTELACLRPWDDHYAENVYVLHFCSDKCALTWQQARIEELGR